MIRQSSMSFHKLYKSFLNNNNQVILTSRLFASKANVEYEDVMKTGPVIDWNKTCHEAEKIVGYPTSFINLRWLLSDEAANVALHLRKLVGSDHPLLKTAKDLLYNEKHNLQPWGLLILLLSKAVGQTEHLTSLEDKDRGILQSQRTLAELTEIIRTGHLVHKGLVNIPMSNKIKNQDTIVFGNKIGILTGDYLLITANGMLARLKNHDLSFIISSALRDLSEGEFVGDRDKQNFPLPQKPNKDSDYIENEQIDVLCTDSPIDSNSAFGYAKKEWTTRNVLSGGSLLGRSCQGAMLLAKQSEDLQTKAYYFGCHVALAWQAAKELSIFSTEDTNTANFLISAPVLFAIQEDPTIYENFISVAKKSVESVDYGTLKKALLKTNAINRTKSLIAEHSSKSNSVLNDIVNNDVSCAIKNIISSF